MFLLAIHIKKKITTNYNKYVFSKNYSLLCNIWLSPDIIPSYALGKNDISNNISVKNEKEYRQKISTFHYNRGEINPSRSLYATLLNTYYPV